MKKLIHIVPPLLMVFATACNSPSVVTTADAAPAPRSPATVPAGDFDEALVTKTLEDANAPDANGKTAWDSAVAINVALDEFSFAPSVLSLKRGQPYVITLKNVGKKSHDFVADDFFKVAAVDSLTFFGADGSELGDVVPGYLKDIGMKPGISVELKIIPVANGTFPLICEVPGHEAHGMHGSIEVKD